MSIICSGRRICFMRLLEFGLEEGKMGRKSRKWKQILAFLLAIAMVTGNTGQAVAGDVTDLTKTDVNEPEAVEEETELVAETAGEEETELMAETAGEEEAELVAETAGEEETELMVETAGEEEKELVAETAGEEETEQETEIAVEKDLPMTLKNSGSSPVDASQIEELSDEETVDVQIAEEGEKKWFSFTPSKTGYYRFLSTGTFDTQASLYESLSGDAVAENDDASNDDQNFSISYVMEKDTTYYFQTSMCYEYITGSFQVRISYVSRVVDQAEIKSYPRTTYYLGLDTELNFYGMNLNVVYANSTTKSTVDYGNVGYDSQYIQADDSQVNWNQAGTYPVGLSYMNWTGTLEITIKDQREMEQLAPSNTFSGDRVGYYRFTPTQTGEYFFATQTDCTDYDNYMTNKIIVNVLDGDSHKKLTAEFGKSTSLQSLSSGYAYYSGYTYAMEAGKDYIVQYINNYNYPYYRLWSKFTSTVSKAEQLSGTAQSLKPGYNAYSFTAEKEGIYEIKIDTQSKLGYVIPGCFFNDSAAGTAFSDYHSSYTSEKTGGVYYRHYIYTLSCQKGQTLSILMTALKEDAQGSVTAEMESEETKSIEAGEKVSGSLSSSDTIDYKFKVDQDGTAVFQIVKSFGNNFSIINSQGKSVSEMEYNSVKGSGSNYNYSVKAELSAGTYWFRFAAGSGTYQLTYQGIIKAKEISIGSLPKKTQYTTGNSELVYDGLVLHVIYEDETEEDIAYGENSEKIGFPFTVSREFDMQDAGLHYVQVSYLNQTVKFAVEISEAEVEAIQLGNSYDAVIEKEGDVQWFSFTPEEFADYSFSSEGAENAYLKLYASNRATLLDSCSYKSGSDFKIKYALAKGTTYYLCTGFQSGDEDSQKLTGTLNISVTKQEISNVTALKLSETQAGSIKESWDVAWMSYTPEVTGTYLFSSQDAAGDTVGMLYDSNGEQLDQNDNGGDGTNFLISYRLEAGTTYFYRIRMKSSSYGSFSVILKLSEAETIPTLTAGSYTYPSISGEGQKQWYQYTAEESGWYEFEIGFLYGYSGTLQGTVYDEDMKTALVSGESDMRFMLSQGKTYYFMIKILEGSSVKLSARLRKIDDLMIGTLTEDQYETVDLPKGSEGQWFSFIPQETGTYRFFSAETDTDSYAELFAENMGTLLASDDNSGGGYSCKITYKLTAGETYYFRTRMKYKDISAGTFSVCISRSLQVKKLEWVAAPKRTYYVMDNSLSYTGLTIKAIYEDDSEETIRYGETGARTGEKITVTQPSGLYDSTGNHLAVGTHKLTITYGEGSLKLAISVLKMSEITEDALTESEETAQEFEDNDRWYAFTPSVSGAYVCHLESRLSTREAETYDAAGVVFYDSKGDSLGGRCEERIFTNQYQEELSGYVNLCQKVRLVELLAGSTYYVKVTADKDIATHSITLGVSKAPVLDAETEIQNNSFSMAYDFVQLNISEDGFYCLTTEHENTDLSERYLTLSVLYGNSQTSSSYRAESFASHAKGETSETSLCRHFTYLKKGSYDVLLAMNDERTEASGYSIHIDSLGTMEEQKEMTGKTHQGEVRGYLFTPSKTDRYTMTKTLDDSDSTLKLYAVSMNALAETENAQEQKGATYKFTLGASLEAGMTYLLIDGDKTSDGVDYTLSNYPAVEISSIELSSNPQQVYYDKIDKVKQNDDLRRGSALLIKYQDGTMETLRENQKSALTGEEYAIALSGTVDTLGGYLKQGSYEAELSYLEKTLTIPMTVKTVSDMPAVTMEEGSGTYEGNTESSCGYGYLRFKASTDGFYDLTLKTDKSSTIEYDHIYNAAYQEMTAYPSTQKIKDDVFENQVRIYVYAGQSCYIKYHKMDGTGNGTGGAFSLKVEKEADQSITAMNLTTEYEVNIEEADAACWFSFTPQETDVYYLNTLDPELPVTMELYRTPDASAPISSISSTGSYNGTCNALLSYTLSGQTTYYFCCKYKNEAATGSYKIRLFKASAAKSLTLQTTDTIYCSSNPKYTDRDLADTEFLITYEDGTTEQMTFGYQGTETRLYSRQGKQISYRTPDWSYDTENTYILDGEYTIRFTYDGVSCSVPVVVSTIQEITGFGLKENRIVLSKTGQTKQLFAVITPKNAQGATVVWSCEDHEVAEIDEEGLLTAKGSGKTNFKAKIKDTEFQAVGTAIVDTIAPEVESVTPTDYGLLRPASHTITITATDDNNVESVKIRYKKQNESEYRTAEVKDTADTPNLSAALKFVLPIEEYEDGDNLEVYFAAVDEAGNEGEEVMRTYTVDKQAPIVETEQTVSGTYGYQTGDIKLSASVISDQGYQLEYEWYDDQNQKIGTEKSYIVPSGLAAGSYDYYYVVIGKNSDGVEARSEKAHIALTISPKTVGLDWKGYEARKYDGTKSKVTAKVSGLIEGDACEVTVTNGDKSHAGTYTAKASALSNQNYQLPQNTTQEYTIEPAELVARYVSESIGFGETPALEISVSGFVGGENKETAKQYIAPGVTDQIPTEEGEHEVTPSGGAAADYSFTYVPGILRITRPAAQEGENGQYLVSHPEGDHGWYRSAVKISAQEGYLLGETEENITEKELMADQETEQGSYSFYVKKEATGTVYQQVTITYQLDGTAPTMKILDRTAQEQGVRVSFEAKDSLSGMDENKITVTKKADGEETDISVERRTNGEYSFLSCGAGSYLITAADQASNQASWNIDVHTARFDSKGGSELDSIDIVSGAALGDLKTPTYPGYRFKGWTDEEGNLVTEETIAGETDLLLTAQWEIMEEGSLVVTAKKTKVSSTYGKEDTSLEVNTDVVLDAEYDLEYQWFQMEEETKEPIDGAKEATYRIPENLSVGTYQYQCEATVTRKDNGVELTGTSEVITLTIVPKTLTLIWSNIASREYDGTSSQVMAKAGGLLFSDTCDVTVTGGEEKNAGSYTAKATSCSNQNYVLPEQTEQGYTIQKAVLTAAYVSETIGYKTTPKLEIKVSGFVGEEDAKTAKNYSAPKIGETIPTSEGEHELTPSGGAADNYTFTYVSGILSITRLPAVEGEDGQYVISKPEGNEGWYSSAVKISAQEGYLLGKTEENITESELLLDQDTAQGSESFYVKDTRTGMVYQQVTLSYRLDTKQPTIQIKEKKAQEKGIKIWFLAEDSLSGINETAIKVTKKAEGKETDISIERSTEGIYTFVTNGAGSYHLTVSDQASNSISQDITVHTVSFDSKGGSTQEPIDIISGTALGTLPHPLYSGHQFIGWEDKEGNLVTEETLAGEEDMVLIAQWKAVEEGTLVVTAEKKKLSTIYGSEEVSLQVHAEAAPDTEYDLQYQWYRINGAEKEKIEGAGSAEYVVSKQQPAGTYQYQCEVSARHKDKEEKLTEMSETITLTIEQKTITLSWSNTASREYDGTRSQVTAIAGGILAGDSCEVTVTGGDEKNAGSYTAKAMALSNANYVLPKQTEIGYKIEKAKLMAGYVSETIKEGEQPKLQIQVSGFVGNETEKTAADYTAPSISGTIPTAVGSYELTPSGGSAGNYRFVYEAGTLTIQKKETPVEEKISLEVTEKQKEISLVYGEKTTMEVSAFVEPKTGVSLAYQWYQMDGTEKKKLAGAVKPEYEITERLAVGTYRYVCEVTAEQTASGKKISAQSDPIAVTIQPKEVAVVWSNAEIRTYDGTASKLSAEVTGLMEGEECEVTEILGGAEVNAGTYVATAAALSNTNYCLATDASISYTIERAQQVITASILQKQAAGTKRYVKASGKENPKFSYAVSGTNMAAVDASGLVQFKKSGKLTITIWAAQTPNYNAAVKKLTIRVAPAKMKLNKLTAKKKQLKVKWIKQAGVDGYEIFYSTAKKFTKSKTNKVIIKKAGTVKKTIKKLKKKKLYYVRIRAFKTIDGTKVYGAYSRVLKKKTK